MAEQFESLLKQREKVLTTPSHLVSHFVVGIAVGSISKGDTFPLPMDFATKYNIDPNVVIEAIPILEDQGVVKVTNQHMIIIGDANRAFLWFEDAFQSTYAPSSASTFKAPENIPVLDEVLKNDQDRYIKRHVIAEGGMGTIFSAYDMKLERNIAIKVVKTGSTSTDSTIMVGDGKHGKATIDEMAFKRFIREAKITGQLDHPSIVPLYDMSIDEDGALQYSMKLIQGKTLAKAFKDASTLSERLLLIKPFLDVCNAVAYAHERNVLHRDLKPSNIMLGDFGETIVIDWGLAKVNSSEDHKNSNGRERSHSTGLPISEDFTQVDEMMGTHGYIAPELFDHGTCSRQTDIYGLGAILFSLMTGKEPKGKSGKKNGQFEDGLSLDDLGSDLPSDLISICQKALNPNPKRRYQSALDLGADIQSFLTGALVRAHEYTPTEKAKKYLSRYKFYAGTVTAALFIVLVVGVFSGTNIYRSNVLLMKANSESKLKLASEYFSQKNYSNTREALDAIPENERSFGWHYLHTQTTMFLTSLEEHSNVVSNVYVASNDHVITISADSSVRTWDPHSNVGRTLWEFPGQSILSTAFDNTNDRLLVTFDDNSFQLLEVRNHSQLFEKSLTEAWATFGVFNPLDQTLIVGGSDGKIHFYSATGVPSRNPMTLTGSISSGAISGDGRTLAVGMSEGVTRLVDLESSSIIGTTNGYLPRISGDSRWSVAFSGNELFLFDLVSQSPSTPINITNAGIRSTAFDPLKNDLYFGDENGTLIHWDPLTDEEITRYEISGTISHISINSDDSTVAVSTHAGTIHVLERDETENDFIRERILLGHEGAITKLQFHPTNEKRLLSSSFDWTAKIWDTNFPNAVIRANLFHGDGLLFDLSSNQALAASIGPDFGSGKMKLTVSDTKNLREVYQESFEIDEDRKHLLSLKFSPNNEQLAFSIQDTGVQILDLKSLKTRSVCTGCVDRARLTKFSKDGKFLYWITATDSIIRWDFLKNKVVADQKFKDVTNFIVDDERNQILVGTRDGRVRAFDSKTLHFLSDLQTHGDSITNLLLTSRGMLVSTSDDKSIKILDLHSNTQVENLAGHPGGIVSLAFHEEYNRLLSCGWDGVTKVWDFDTFENVFSLNSHDQTYRMIFASDNALLVLDNYGTLERISF